MLSYQIWMLPRMEFVQQIGINCTQPTQTPLLFQLELGILLSLNALFRSAIHSKK